MFTLRCTFSSCNPKITRSGSKSRPISCHRRNAWSFEYKFGTAFFYLNVFQLNKQCHVLYACLKSISWDALDGTAFFFHLIIFFLYKNNIDICFHCRQYSGNILIIFFIIILLLTYFQWIWIKLFYSIAKVIC